jgi:hypothetical protein
MKPFRLRRPLLQAATLVATAFVATYAAAVPVITIVDYAVNNATAGNGNDAGVNFAQNYGAYTPTGATWSNAGADDPTVDPGQTGAFHSPFFDNGATASYSFFAVNASSANGDPTTPGQPSPATLTLATAKTAFTLLWGSVDTFNSIQFGTGAGAQTITGTDIMTQLNADRAALATPLPALTANGSGGYRITTLVTITGLSSFTDVKFISERNGQDANAFEFAFVPGPSSTFLFLTAIGCLGFARRARARTV